MEIQLERSKLLQILDYCQNVSEKKSTMPILSHALLIGEDNQLLVLVTDLEVRCQASISGFLKFEGRCCIPIRNLASIIRDLSGEEVLLKINDSQLLEVSSDSAIFRLNTLPIGEFPTFDYKLSKKCANIPSGLFLQALKHTLFSISDDETQRVLNSVVLDLRHKGKNYVVSTDRHRLSYFNLKKIDPTGCIFENMVGNSFIIPKKGAIELKNLCELAGDDSTIGVSISENILCFQFERINLFTRLIHEEYPNYDYFFETEDGVGEIILNRGGLIGALKRMMLLSSEKLRSVQLNFTKEHIHMYSTSESLGDAREVVQIAATKNINFNELEVVLNARYLIEPILELTCENVSFFIRDAESQFVLSPTGEDYCKAIIMPLRM